MFKRGKKDTLPEGEFQEDREWTAEMMRSDAEFMQDLMEQQGIEEIDDKNYKKVQNLYEQFQTRQALEGKLTKDRIKFLIEGNDENVGAARHLRGFYSKELGKMGLEAAPDDIQGIEEYMESLGQDNPRHLEKLAARARIFQEHSRAIESYQKKFLAAGKSADILDMARHLEEQYFTAQKKQKRPKWMVKMGLLAEGHTEETRTATRHLLHQFNLRVEDVPRAVKSLRALDQARRDLLLEGAFLNDFVEARSLAADETFEQVFTVEEAGAEEIPEPAERGAEEIVEEKPAPLRERAMPSSAPEDSSMYDEVLERQTRDTEPPSMATMVGEAYYEPAEKKPKAESAETFFQAEMKKEAEKDDAVQELKKEMEEVSYEAAFDSDEVVDVMIESADDRDTARELLRIIQEIRLTFSREQALKQKKAALFRVLQNSLVKMGLGALERVFQRKISAYEKEEKPATEKNKKEQAAITERTPAQKKSRAKKAA